MNYVGKEELPELKRRKNPFHGMVCFLLVALVAVLIVMIFFIKNKEPVQINHDEILDYVYQGEPYVVINSNIPDFSDADINAETFENYSELDSKGRCGVAFAKISVDMMPTEPRGEIGSVRPTGWHTVKYNELIDGNYLYNRCHLIAYCLTGENANEKNLITGTRYLNVEGMLPIEVMISEYIENTNNHVLYRVTPVFDGDDMLAKGVQIEAYSVEDEGEGICLNIFCFNVQPGIVIDYTNGENWLEK